MLREGARSAGTTCRANIMSIRYKWRNTDLEMEKTVNLDELRNYLRWEFEGRIELLAIGGRSNEKK